MAPALSGLILSLSNPPADLGPLAFVALVPLLWALRTARPRRGALLGLVWGVAYYGVVLSWLIPFGVIAWLPLVVAQAAYAAVFGAVVPHLWRDVRPLRSTVAVAGLWTALEWVRGMWPLGGFTWGGLGYTQHGNGLLLPLASITGVWGVTFVVMAVNALVCAASTRALDRTGEEASTPAVGRDGRARGHRTAGWPAAAGLVVLAGILVVAPASIRLPAAGGPRLDVAVVQGNVPLALAGDRLLQGGTVWRNHVGLHRTLAGKPPDLAVWPENALDFDPATAGAPGEAVASAIRDVGAPTIVGAITEAPGSRYFNQALLYSGEGRVVDRYTKIHLVPFGEYVPWRPWFNWTDRYRPTSRDLVPGRTVRVFRVGGVAVAAPICFENVFPDLFRRFVAGGAEVVILTTNDSSFRYSVASEEHVIMSKLRAVEAGRWIVQAAISGKSAVIDSRGRIHSETDLFTRTILRSAVPTSSRVTVYTRLGDWFPMACALGIAAGLVIVALRRWRDRPLRSPGRRDALGTPERAETGGTGR